MDLNGSQKNPIDPNGSQSIPMDPKGSKWSIMDPNGSQWIPMDPNGSVFNKASTLDGVGKSDPINPTGSNNFCQASQIFRQIWICKCENYKLHGKYYLRTNKWINHVHNKSRPCLYHLTPLKRKENLDLNNKLCFTQFSNLLLFTRFFTPLDLVKFYPSLPFPPYGTHFNPLSSTAVG